MEDIIKFNANQLSLTIGEFLAAIENGDITADLKRREINEVDFIEIEPFRRSRKFDYDLRLERFVLDDIGDPGDFEDDYFDEIGRLEMVFYRYKINSEVRQADSQANTEDWQAFVSQNSQYKE
ncbi:hypothetical protein [Paucilactobacillus nenjiangensis]|uniref:Uncharacterized protein n=1 Tax=Paucilactobacillus nenjiangensis TaxID=1296540 RepID=A0A5P1X192_9LACO|nr:hypothetical protein [Paucilactobacillus nenjiangensis]QER66654.1 hypothetical protein F0161_01410 [Paucilactobacillus nenjiangensis]